MRRNAIVALVLGGMLAGFGQAEAQTTGMPIFQAPYRAFQHHELGVALADPGAGVALLGFYSYGSGPHDIGLRAGFHSVNRAGALGGDYTALLLGADFRTRVLTHTEDFPLDGALTVGLGASIANAVTVGYVPIGLSLGRRVDLEGSSTSFVPYVQPVLTPTFGDRSDLDFSVGLGVDIRFSPRLDLRVSGGIGDNDGVSVSLAWLR